MCFNPIIVRESKPDEATVPCGKCPPCRSRRVSSWSFRLMVHYRAQNSGHFVTLTYDTDHVPIVKNRYPMTLDFTDLKNFFKRLRKHESKSKLAPGEQRKSVSYYAVGEYGTENKRPHYHIILFNATVDNILRSWRDLSGRPLGSVHFGEVTEASVGYCLKYISKPGRIPEYKNDARIREQSRMSKGIGANYLSRSMLNWHHTHGAEGVYCSLRDGKKIALPRYYRERIGYDAEIFEQSATSYLNQIRDREQRDIAKMGEEKYYQQKQARIKEAYRKMYTIEKSKKL